VNTKEATCTCVPPWPIWDDNRTHQEHQPGRCLRASIVMQPIERNTHEILASLCQLAEEQLAELRHANARAAGPGESRSSACVKTSTRGVDLEVKSYADGLLPDAIDDAIEGYRRGQLKLAELQANQWRDTVDGLAEAKAVPAA
jgi:hypothetical protein